MFGRLATQARRLEEIGGRYDRIVLGTGLALACFGIVMVASSSIAIAEGMDVSPLYFLVRHVVFVVAGAVLGLLLARMELRVVERWSRLMLLASFALLLAVFLPGIGKSVNGAQRWINLGVSSFQAVEAVKLMLIVWLASYLVRYREQVQSHWWGLVKPMAIAAGLIALLLLQPDFGSAALICAITAGMVWLGGVRVRYLFAPLLLGVPMLAWAALSQSYRVRRLTSFLDPWADPFADGFQLTQALIAIGRGEWFGVGLGGSVQKLFYLPEAHTDFIVAVIAEELGFVGLTVLIALFALLAGRAFWLGLRAVEMGRAFAGFCAFGVALWISLQSLVSIGVNLGLLPTKGLTLPLISSGGSSVLMTCAGIGLLLRVSFEIDRAGRQSARARGEDPVPQYSVDGPAECPLPSAALARGRGRIEPTLGAAA
ncbi:MAG TPA: putative lipid II flippase FtsW [Xanthomonadaceae bacterium]|nr:putative lipid II flippase FtsW [Xanthomonadaceae bacterium]